MRRYGVAYRIDGQCGKSGVEVIALGAFWRGWQAGKWELFSGTLRHHS